jgi:hypothetical protein
MILQDTQYPDEEQGSGSSEAITPKNIHMRITEIPGTGTKEELDPSKFNIYSRQNWG